MLQKVLTLFILVALSAWAHAQPSGIYAEWYSVSNPADGWAAVPGFPNRHGGQAGLLSGSHVTINNANAVPYRIFAVSPTTTSIGNITVNGTGVLTTLIVGTGVIFPNPGSALPEAGATNIGTISNGGTARVNLQVRALGDISTVNVYKVTRIDADELLGNVSHNGDATTAPSLDTIEVRTTSSVLIRAYKGNIGTVRTAGACAATIEALIGTVEFVDIAGAMTGSVLAPQGSIFNVDVGGDLGTSTSTVNITARDNLRKVSAARAWANVNVTSATGLMQNVTTTTGDFVGSIHAFRVDSIPQQTAGFSFAGDLDADLTIDDYLAASAVAIGGELKEGRRIKIGQGWGNGRTMTIGSLAGQVDLNRLNGSALWSGTIRVGPPGSEVTLSPAPHYDNLSSTLGGGAVGRVPYSLHDLESFPENGESLAVLNSTTTVLLSHYGPVFWGTGSVPFAIAWAEAGTGNWETLPTTDFTYFRDPQNHRDVYITAVTEFDFKEGWDYRIQPTSALKCEGVGSRAPSRVWTTTST